jgi:hypothetical protein
VILISRNFVVLSRNFAKFRINYFAKLFRYVHFSNTSTFREISYKLFREIVLLCNSFEFDTQRINFNQHFLKVLPVFRIREILARIRIIGSVPEKNRYKYLWIFDIEVIFLVVLKCNKIQKCILPCENFNSLTKISRYFAKFCIISRYEISRNKQNYFAKYEIIISRNFATEKFRRPPYGHNSTLRIRMHFMI